MSRKIYTINGKRFSGTTTLREVVSRVGVGCVIDSEEDTSEPYDKADFARAVGGKAHGVNAGLADAIIKDIVATPSGEYNNIIKAGAFVRAITGWAYWTAEEFVVANYMYNAEDSDD